MQFCTCGPLFSGSRVPSVQSWFEPPQRGGRAVARVRSCRIDGQHLVDPGVIHIWARPRHWAILGLLACVFHPMTTVSERNGVGCESHDGRGSVANMLSCRRLAYANRVSDRRRSGLKRAAEARRQPSMLRPSARTLNLSTARSGSDSDQQTRGRETPTGWRLPLLLAPLRA